MARRKHGYLALAAICLLAGCPAPTGKAPTTPTGTKAPPRPVASKPPLPGTGLMKPDNGIISRDGAGIISRDGAGIISRDGAGIISRDGAGLIGADGATLTGVAKLPAGIISRDGAGLIGADGGSLIGADGGSLIGADGGTLIGADGGTLVARGPGAYRVAALPAEVPVRKQLVYLLDASGKLVVDAANEPITAETDEQGRFTFKGFVTRKNLVIAIKLHDEKGLLTAVLPRGEAPTRTVGLDLATSLTATYIQDQYIRAQADPVGVFERLPADLEATTRAAVAKALAASDKPPADLAPTTVVGHVDGLRKQDAAVEAQFAEVKRVLLAGLSDQGAGQPADSVETDALDVAIDPQGRPVFTSESTLRVWRKDQQGRLEVVAGNGLAPAAGLAASAPAPGDGGPATAAAMRPTGLAYLPDGTLLVADADNRRIREIGADGIVKTRVADDRFEELRDFTVGPDGTLWIATFAAVFEVRPGQAPTLVAGTPRPFRSETWFLAPSNGEKGKPVKAADALFRAITSIARDPGDGALYLWDFGAGVRRIRGGEVDLFADGRAQGFGGDGGPVADAQVNAFGALAFKADGTLLLADTLNHRLREVAGGTIRTVAGTGEASFRGDGGDAVAAALIEPIGVTFAPDGAAYFVDNGYVRRLAGGKIETAIGGARGFDQPRPATEVQLLGPADLKYDAAANAMWVGDTRHLWRWTLGDGKMVSVFGGGPAGEAFQEGQAATKSALMGPRHVQDLGGGKLAFLVADPRTGGGRVVQLENGVVTTLAGGAATGAGMDQDGPALGASISAGDSVLVRHGDRWYYSIAINGTLRRFQVGGNTEKYGGGGLDTVGGVHVKDMNFFYIHSMAKGPDGLFYVTTPRYIYRVDPTTNIANHYAGAARGTSNEGVPAKEAMLRAPVGLAWDAAGNLYYAEPETGLVCRLRADDGKIERVAGAGTRNLAGASVDTGLGAPTGLAFDKEGDLYIADNRHGQIKRVRKADLGL